MSWLDNESDKDKAKRVGRENLNKMFDKKRCASFGCSNITQGSDEKCPECLRKHNKSRSFF
jgi:hypothetical protein